ncbi:exopolysaccharide biosynthesis polyprenyl glycosylphosphotransferase [Streptomyces lucensis JCM 4490]|uniref:Exopolysaccharide biosynthesis polyprenyl glycosylphosphotransferase n=1 Tax=Streptomyces lucensis JCM 4490 TaxID=1306176 RepID=A0A918MQC9_9ACTN|nr:exopolysaccharide biosynthesis polyprenyl glycosylphosphotransferase [Streptomyces lucensis]GGW44152.1 exopolysaccharide biosynthesis polyprenyl glycosylphosphotransferase [Streptomyces lucensis JCM 4490]
MRPSHIAAPRQAPVSLPPVPVRPRAGAARWYGPVSVCVDAAGAALPVAAAIVEVQEPHPLRLAAVAAVLWPLTRVAGRRYTPSAWGDGGGLRAVLGDWLLLVGALATLRVLCGLSSVPAEAFTALIPALALTAVCHKVIHRHLLAARRDGRALRPAVVVGAAATVDAVVGQLAQRTDHEHVIVGSCPVGDDEVLSGVPVYRRLSREVPADPGQDAAAVLGAVDELSAELVFVVPGPQMSGERLRWLSWALHDRGHQLVVVPGVVDVARRRVRLTSAAGLTMLHVVPPLRRGVPVLAKAVLDRVGALLLLALLAPLFLVLTLAVRLGSPGPAFYRQIRVGRHNTRFPMWKFRTMVVGADRLKAGLEAANENDGHMFKMRSDPRVTPLGRVLRRYSLDELPQLFNVLLGHMSLVGPRPPVPEEVAEYNEVEMRRLHVKPGLTGLWQVSGRSDLSWHETVALDLRYVDNWTLAGDLHVVARTARAVLDGQGAY